MNGGPDPHRRYDCHKDGRGRDCRAQSGPPRFTVGEEVECSIEGGYTKGRIVALHYRESDWPVGATAPYQVELEDGDLIYAPWDHDGCIRKPIAPLVPAPVVPAPRPVASGTRRR